MKCIELITKEWKIFVDNDDYKKVSKIKWYLNHTKRRPNLYYAQGLYNGKIIFMHRFILNAPRNLKVDHINGNGLDNRKSNLRLATTSQNNCNCGIQSNNTSGFKGVCWKKQTKKWMAKIVKNGKQINLGYFSDINLAKEAYNKAARKYHKKYARLN